jgi:CheY-like chemotaxis protein
VGPHKILLVEDDDALRASLVTVLRARSYEVTEAADGKQALELLAGDLPDLVVCDIHMPHIGGWQLCRRLKSEPRTRAIPVIMMTADLIGTEDAEYGLSLGADEYLAKPFLLDVLLYNVARLLEGPVDTAGPAPPSPPAPPAPPDPSTPSE